MVLTYTKVIKYIQSKQDEHPFGRDYGAIKTEHVLDKVSTTLESPYGICYNSWSNTFLISDLENSCIKVLDATHFNVIKTIGSKGGTQGKFLEPRSVSMNLKGDIAVSDSKVNRIQIFNGNGTLLVHFGRYGAARGQFKDVMGIIYTLDGNIAVADMGNNRIQIVSNIGTVISVYGKPGTKPGEFQVSAI